MGHPHSHTENSNSLASTLLVLCLKVCHPVSYRMSALPRDFDALPGHNISINDANKFAPLSFLAPEMDYSVFPIAFVS